MLLYKREVDKRIKELEAELAASKANNQQYCRIVLLVEAERDRLREALLGLNAAIDYHWNDHINVTQRMPDAHAKMIVAAQQIAKQALKETT